MGGAQAKAGRRSKTTNFPSAIGQPFESVGTFVPLESVKGRASLTTSQNAGGREPTSTPSDAEVGGGGKSDDAALIRETEKAK